MKMAAGGNSSDLAQYEQVQGQACRPCCCAALLQLVGWSCVTACPEKRSCQHGQHGRPRPAQNAPAPPAPPPHPHQTHTCTHTPSNPPHPHPAHAHQTEVLCVPGRPSQPGPGCPAGRPHLQDHPAWQGHYLSRPRPAACLSLEQESTFPSHSGDMASKAAVSHTREHRATSAEACPMQLASPNTALLGIDECI